MFCRKPRLRPPPDWSRHPVAPPQQALNHSRTVLKPSAHLRQLRQGRVELAKIRRIEDRVDHALLVRRNHRQRQRAAPRGTKRAPVSRS